MKPQALVFTRDFDVNKIFTDLSTNTFNNKPVSALWTSTWNDDISEISWIRWNLKDYYYDIKESLLESCLFKIYPKSGLKIYELDKLEDLENIPKINIFDLVEDKEKIYRNRDYFNYKKLSNSYDGFHITENMVRSVRSGINISLDFVEDIDGFDCESIVWFNSNWIDHVELVEENLIDYLLKIN